MAVASSYLSDVIELLAPMWVEISFITFFGLGFAMLRFENYFSKRCPPKGRQKGMIDLQFQLQKDIETSVSSGQGAAALKIWRTSNSRVPTPVEALKLIVQALLDENPKVLVTELVEHISIHREVLGNARTSGQLLDVLARAGNISLMEDLVETLQSSLHIKPSAFTYEVLLGGYASVGNSNKVFEITATMESSRVKLSARAYSLTVKGFLKNGMVDLALHQIQKMHTGGFSAPSFAVAQLFRTARDTGPASHVRELFEAAFSDAARVKLPLTPEVATIVIDDCSKRDDLEMAFRVERMAHDAKTALPAAAYDSLLKLCVMHADVRAIPIFEHMRSKGVHVSEGLCVGLLARCADTKFLRFAEEIARFVRGRDGMSIAVYSALMKVYAYCGMYDKACDLYAEIRKEGLEPDALMYGCLMKFSVECGRTELSQELFQKAPTLDIQNYMSLIRAAGHDRDVDRAFAILDKLKASGVSTDIAVYNCVLDACVSSKDMKRANELLEQIKQMNYVDIITYNTLLKGYCSVGDLQGAKDLFMEMESVGLQPNDVSYNCLINAAVSKGAIKEAWSTIDMMERSGVAVDNYTISIMMKALKTVKDPHDVGKALSLLDRTGLDVFSDEVLLNTVLETCIKHQQFDRISAITAAFAKSALLPSVHTYGSMIKACSTLKRVDRCWDLWQDMTQLRALEPNDIVLGCMLDALVCNRCIDEAVSLFSAWKTKVPPNTVMYSTLIKGFASSQRAREALKLWEEMHELRLPMNTVVYNALVDSQARVGETEAVLKLVAGMERDGCKPDTITYSTIVKAYCFKGDIDKALEIFRDMQANRMIKDCIVYNTVLDGCTRHNRMDVADLVLDDMEKRGLQPSNFTLGILVKMYGRRHQLDKAFEVVQEFPKKYGIHPNPQVSTCLISACVHEGKIDRAFQVFKDLQASGQIADSRAYSVLIGGCVRMGCLDRAAHLVEEACDLILSSDSGSANHKASQVLDASLLENLFRALAQRQKMETWGNALMDKLRKAGIPLSSDLLSSAVNPKNDGSRRQQNAPGNKRVQHRRQ